MASIREFDVIEPPTSGELQNAVHHKLQFGGLLSIVVRGQQEVPTPEPEEFAMSRIAQTVHPREGGMIVAGYTKQGEQLTIRMPEDLGAPAVASLVTVEVNLDAQACV